MTTTTRTYAFCPMLLALCRDRSSSMIFTLVWPVIPLVLQVLVLAYFVASMAYLASTGRAEFYRNDTGLLSAIPCDPAVSATFHYTDPTRPDKLRGLVGDPRGPNGLCRRPGSGLVGSVQWNLDLSQQIATVLIVTRGRIAAATRRIALSLSTASCGLLEGRCHGNHFLFSPHNFFFVTDQCVLNFAHSATTRSTVVGVIHEVDRR